MTLSIDDLQHTLFDTLTAERPTAVAAVPPHRRVLTPAEARAGETTRVAREFTEAEAEKRQAQVARLRQARLEQEAADRAAKAAESAKPKPKRKR